MKKNTYYNYNEDFFNKNSQELYYIYGLLAADGYINKESNTVELALNSKDVHIVEEIRDIICKDKPIYNKKNVDAYMLKICNKNIAKNIHNFLSMTSSKKHETMKFPKNMNEKQVKSFIRGYIDGDGTIDTTKGYKGRKVYIGARLRILGNYDFLYELNKETKKYIKHNTNAILKKGKENVYCVTYNFSTANNILNWIYDNSKIHLKRKNDRYNEILKMKI